MCVPCQFTTSPTDDGFDAEIGEAMEASMPSWPKHLKPMDV